MYKTAVGASTQHINSHEALRIAKGDPDASELVDRISLREPLVQMPPLATELVDTQAVADIRAWITALK